MSEKKEEILAAFRQGSEKLLLDSIDEGFCIIKVLFDDQDNCFDYRFLETNRIFEQQTGLTNAKGKQMKILAPDHEQYWFDIYGEVAKSGKPVRFEKAAEALGHFYEVYAFSVGVREDHLVAILFKDISERKRQERKQAFVVRLSDALRLLSDGGEVQETAARILGEELHVDRVFYATAVPTTSEDRFVHLVKRDYYRKLEVASLEGRYPPHAGKNLYAGLVRGEKLVIPDVDKLPQGMEAYRQRYKSLDVRAFIAVPLVKDNQYVAAIGVTDRDIRAWLPLEIELVEETAERTWAALKRVEAEEKWKESKVYLAEAMKAARMGSWRADLSTGLLTRDAHLNRLFGKYARDSTLPFEEALEEIYEEDRVDVKKNWEHAISDKSIYSTEFRVLHDDGSVHWMHGEGRFLEGQDDGEPDTMTGLTSEITRQKEMEKMLGQYEKHHQLLIEQTEDFAIIFLSLEGIITDWNKGAEVIFQWTKDEAVGQSGEMLFTPADQQKRIPELELQKALKTGNANDKRWMQRKDGLHFWANGKMHSLKDESGRLTGLFKILQDETSQKVTEEALYQSEENYRAIVSQTMVGVMKVDLSGNISFVNNQMSKMLHFDVDELLNEKVTSFIYEEDLKRNASLFERLCKEGVAYEIEKRMRCKGGAYLWVNNQISPIFEKGEKRPSSAVIISVDISKQKMLEKQKDEFISVASHELKTPLTGIKAYAELLHDALDEQEKEYTKELTGKLNHQVDRLNKLVYELLDTTRISEGRLGLNKAKFDLNRLIKERATELQLTAPSRQLVLETGQISALYADKERIAQVLTNLMTNALKYSPQDKKIIIFTEDIDQKQVKIGVRDFGKGVSQEMQREIFTRFSRMKNSKGISGFGLGLYISMEIVKKHNGILKVESPPSEQSVRSADPVDQKLGSVFYFILPYRGG